jgi:thiol:disulfide interchange protein DsbA
MNRALVLYPLLLLSLLATPLQAREFDEGIDYQRISPGLGSSAPEGKVEVMEMFWYGCPHCFKLEPQLHAWIEEMGDKIHFVRRPSMLNPAWETHARAYYALLAMGVADELHQPFFDAIHVDRRRLADLDQLAEFVAEQGQDGEKFRQMFRSFYVETQIRKEQSLARRGFASGVPAVVIDGVYFTDTTIGGGYKGMLETMTHLVDKVLAGNN